MSSDTSRNNNNNNLRSSARSKATTVPAFSIRSIQPGNRVQQPPRINVFAERPTPSLAFRRIYQRGDLPVCIVHESRLFRLGWKVSLSQLELSFVMNEIWSWIDNFKGNRMVDSRVKYVL